MNMSKVNFDEMLRHIVRELDYLVISYIENDKCPLDIPDEAKKNVVKSALNAFNFPATEQNINDGINYYYASQIVDAIKGRLK